MFGHDMLTYGTRITLLRLHPIKVESYNLLLSTQFIPGFFMSLFVILQVQ